MSELSFFAALSSYGKPLVAFVLIAGSVASTHAATYLLEPANSNARLPLIILIPRPIRAAFIISPDSWSMINRQKRAMSL